MITKHFANLTDESAISYMLISGVNFFPNFVSYKVDLDEI